MMLNIHASNYSLSYESNIRAIKMSITGYTTSQQFRILTEQLLNMMIIFGVDKVLADTTDMPIIGTEDQEWFIYDWWPRALRAGFKICAMVNSKYFFNNIAVNTMVKGINKENFVINFFDDVSCAVEWLATHSGRLAH